MPRARSGARCRRPRRSNDGPGGGCPAGLDRVRAGGRGGARNGDRAYAGKAVEAFPKPYGPKWPKGFAEITDGRGELLTFYDFPAAHWIHSRTTNPVESARDRRAITGADLVALIRAGATFENGHLMEREESAA
ncbi:transposase [Streptomyces sp. NBC_00525]|nr:transposase [Streptomyces sp. NBC_00525]WUC96837.1 transposase [Streptomyces sp. NBC_00525]